MTAKAIVKGRRNQRTSVRSRKRTKARGVMRSLPCDSPTVVNLDDVPFEGATDSWGRVDWQYVARVVIHEQKAVRFGPFDDIDIEQWELAAAGELGIRNIAVLFPGEGYVYIVPRRAGTGVDIGWHPAGYYD